MKRNATALIVALGLASVAIYAVQGGGVQAAQAPAQAPAGGRGGAGGGGGFGGGGRGNPEQDARRVIPTRRLSFPPRRSGPLRSPHERSDMRERLPRMSLQSSGLWDDYGLAGWPLARLLSIASHPP